jgi:hypothetical protein
MKESNEGAIDGPNRSAHCALPFRTLRTAVEATFPLNLPKRGSYITTVTGGIYNRSEQSRRSPLTRLPRVRKAGPDGGERGGTCPPRSHRIFS